MQTYISCIKGSCRASKYWRMKHQHNYVHGVRLGESSFEVNIPSLPTLLHPHQLLSTANLKQYVTWSTGKKHWERGQFKTWPTTVIKQYSSWRDVPSVPSRSEDVNVWVSTNRNQLVKSMPPYKATLTCLTSQIPCLKKFSWTPRISPLSSHLLKCWVHNSEQCKYCFNWHLTSVLRHVWTNSLRFSNLFRHNYRRPSCWPPFMWF